MFVAEYMDTQKPSRYIFSRPLGRFPKNVLKTSKFTFTGRDSHGVNFEHSS